MLLFTPAKSCLGCHSIDQASPCTFYVPWRQASTNEINKILGKRWSALPKEERKFYDDKADKSKLRYLEVSRIVD